MQENETYSTAADINARGESTASHLSTLVHYFSWLAFSRGLAIRLIRLQQCSLGPANVRVRGSGFFNAKKSAI